MVNIGKEGDCRTRIKSHGWRRNDQRNARLNNEQKCFLFYSVTWLKQTLTIFSKISLKLSFILASLELLHNPFGKFPKKEEYVKVW